MASDNVPAVSVGLVPGPPTQQHAPIIDQQCADAGRHPRFLLDGPPRSANRSISVYLPATNAVITMESITSGAAMIWATPASQKSAAFADVRGWMSVR